MKLIKGELVATGPELVAAPAVLELKTGPLSRMPRVRSDSGDAEAVRAFFRDARPEIGALYKAAIATLAAPVRIGTFHYALGEEALNRMILAWGGMTGTSVVAMVHTGDESGWSIAMLDPDALAELLASVLLSNVALKPGRIHMALSQDSALVLLAILHLLRHGRLNALLRHEPSPVGFDAAAIPEAMEATGQDDYRWPLLFFDKVLPFSLNGLVWEEQIEPALKELADRGVIEKVKGGKDTWALTALGYQLAVADAQHMTKAGLRITQSADEDSLKGHETFLFMRALQDVIMYDLGGKEAVVASVSFEDLATLAKNVLTLPDELVAADAAAVPAAGTCPSCGGTVTPGARFCPSCGTQIGAAAAPACAKCGAPLAKGARFCAKCGAPA